MFNLLFLAETATKTGKVFDLDKYIKLFVDWCVNTGVKVVLGAIILFFAFKLINLFSNGVKKRLVKRNADKTLTAVIHGSIRVVAKLVLVLFYLGVIGIETASVGTIIASLSVCIGLAVQGSLSNLAGGFVILVMRPFKIGDVIKSQGCSGTVESIGIFYTTVVSADNIVNYIPNGKLANDVITNNTKKDTRRVDMVFAISYESDYELARKAILELAEAQECRLQDKEVTVRMAAHADSAVEINCRIWVPRTEYWNVYYAMLEQVKAKFEELNIEIPYNKIDVNIKKD